MYFRNTLNLSNRFSCEGSWCGWHSMTLVRSLTGEAGILHVLNINGAHSLLSVAPNVSWTLPSWNGFLWNLWSLCYRLVAYPTLSIFGSPTQHCWEIFSSLHDGPPLWRPDRVECCLKLSLAAVQSAPCQQSIYLWFGVLCIYFWGFIIFIFFYILCKQ